MTTVQMNTRIDEDLKRRGDAVFAQNGYSPSQVVRVVWSYAAEHNEVPPFMKEADSDDRRAEIQTKLARAKDGAGLALKVAEEQCGFEAPSAEASEFATWRELRDEVYDELLGRMEKDCRS